MRLNDRFNIEKFNDMHDIISQQYTCKNNRLLIEVIIICQRVNKY